MTAAASKPNTAELSLVAGSSVPMYQQIKDAIVQKISTGEWQPGQLIPSENQLAESIGVSRMTITRPLRELAAEGLLTRVHGLGTFVAEPPRRAHLIELVSIAEEIQQHGRTHHAQVVSLKTVKANRALQKLMKLNAGSKLYKAVILHFQDDLPIQLELRHVNPVLVPEFIHIDFTKTTTTEYLVSQIRPSELEHVVQAVMPDELIAQQLEIPVTEPCLKLSRRTWLGSEIVTAADLIYPSSRYILGDRFKPTTATPNGTAH